MSDGFNYNTINRPIPAGEESVFNITGSYVLVVEATHSDFKFRVDGGTENYWAVGIMIGGATTPLPFKKITIVNKGAPLNITMVHGDGPVRDGRMSLSGGTLQVAFDGTQHIAFDGTQAVAVQNFPATQPVSLPGTQNVKFTTPQSVKFTSAQEVTFANIARLEDSFTKLTEIVAKLSSQSGLLSLGWVDLTGASYATASGVKVSLATAAQNINGVSIHRFNGENRNNSWFSVLLYDGKPLTNRSHGDLSTDQVVQNLFLPAGKKVEIESSQSSRPAHVWYEVH